MPLLRQTAEAYAAPLRLASLPARGDRPTQAKPAFPDRPYRSQGWGDGSAAPHAETAHRESAASPAAAPQLAPQAPVHVLLGRRHDAAMRRIRAAVDDHPVLQGRRVQWHVPARAAQTPQTAQRAAEAAHADGGLVLAIGGDGTLNAAAQACWQRDVPMAVVAQGTFNFFSRQHGVAEGVRDALTQLGETLAEGRVRAVQPGLLNGQIFLVNSSLGLYPRLLAEREAANARFGRHRIVALLAGLWSLMRGPRGQVLRLREQDAQGRERQRMALVSTLFVGHNRLQLGRLGLDAAEAPGQLVVTTLAPCAPTTALGLVVKAARGRLGEHEAIENFACTALTVEAAGYRQGSRVRVAFDGERAWMQMPLRFSRAGRPLWLLGPEPEAVAQSPAQAAKPASAEAGRSTAHALRTAATGANAR